MRGKRLKQCYPSRLLAVSKRRAGQQVVLSLSSLGSIYLSFLVHE